MTMLVRGSDRGAPARESWHNRGMALVSLEQDARYRRDGDRYVEVCRACGHGRTGDVCACGATFERLKRGFLVTQWTATTIVPRMPDRCPHCEGPTSRVRSVTLRMPTAMARPGTATWSRVTFEIPSCPKLLPPYLAWLGVLASTVLLVFFGLAAFFHRELPLIAMTVIAAAALVASWRAYGWIRFVGFDHRALRFRVRRPGYARELAELNAGRVR